ncbi:MAG: MerR family transcriptional regulator [Chromatiales bacterium]|nr:MerR family transcriptional regulator [Chromatiales bacterium]
MLAESAVSYSADELTEATGVSRRNIAYYIQQGLLPRIGRRGPRTRYPATFLRRLRLITGIRDLQDRGLLPTVSLAAIGQLLARLGDQGVQRLLQQGLPAAEIADLLASAAANGRTADPGRDRPTGGDGRRYGLADAGIRRASPAAPAAARPEPQALPEGLSELGELLRQLELAATLGRQKAGPGAAEQWTQLPVTARVYLTVRGLGPDSAALAEAAARLLRQALRSREGSTSGD